jgi:hypothetical protein
MFGVSTVLFFICCAPWVPLLGECVALSHSLQEGIGSCCECDALHA